MFVIIILNMYDIAVVIVYNCYCQLFQLFLFLLLLFVMVFAVAHIGHSLLSLMDLCLREEHCLYNSNCIFSISCIVYLCTKIIQKFWLLFSYYPENQIQSIIFLNIILILQILVVGSVKMSRPGSVTWQRSMKSHKSMLTDF